MSRDSSLVQRLIAFLRRPDALEYDERRGAENPYDDYEPQPVEAEPEPDESTLEAAFVEGQGDRPPHDASRLDALVMRALHQFNAHHGYIIRQTPDGRMEYCTGRDFHGRYIDHTEAVPDRRAMFLALDSGESQFFVHTDQQQKPTAVLCGPLWDGDRVIGVLYIHQPARNRLHRGIFDVFCDQAARMLSTGMA
jgi:hypothetical protein